MISAALTQAVNFPSPCPDKSQQGAARPARASSWLALIGQRVERRKQADANCLIH